MRNLNDTTPAAPIGGANVRWQEDASGNTSAYIANRKVTIAPVAGVLTLDASASDVFQITVNAAITSMSITNPSDGQEIILLWAQDTTGHAVTTATNLLGVTTPSTTANTFSSQAFTYNVGDTNWYAVAPGVTGM